MLLEETPAVLSLGKFCEDNECTDHWTSGQKNHISPKMARTLIARHQTVYHLSSLVLSTSSSTTSTPTSSASSSQDYVISTERSGSTRAESRGNPLHKPAKTENTNNKEGDEEVQSDLLHDLPDWLQEFRANLVDERSPLEPRRDPSPGDRDTSSSSHELPMELWPKVEAGSVKHSVYTHFPKTQMAISAWRRK